MTQRKAPTWIWYIFILISVGLTLSFSFVGRYNTTKKVEKKEFGQIQLFRVEKPCLPLHAPCAAYVSDAAVVVKVYEGPSSYRVEVKTVGAMMMEIPSMSAVLLGKTGGEIGGGVALQRGGDDSYGGVMVKGEAADSVRISFRRKGLLAVVDMPLL